MQQLILSDRRSLGSIRDIYHQLQTFFKLNLYALSLFCTTGEDWEAWVKLVLREFVVEDMSGCNGMWLLGENWAVRGFEVFGSVETREWERVRHLQYLGFLVQNILSGLCQPTFSGEGRCEREPLSFEAFCGFLITASKVDPCIFVRSFVMLWVLGNFGTFMRFRFYL